MNSSAICPISTLKVDENVARLNAGFAVIAIVFFIYTQNILVLSGLLIDFLLRSFQLSKFSPLAIISKFIVDKFGIKKQIINAGPKIFASRIGVIFNVAIICAFLLGFETFTVVLASIFAFCAFLEAVFSFCVACKIYPFIYKLTIKSTVSLQ